MSKIRTLTQLDDVMSEEFAWRKRELHDLKTLIWRHWGSRLQAVTVRSAVAVLYAHWEGFVKRIASAYLEYVSRQELRHEELCDCFVALSVRAMLKTSSASGKIEDHIKVVKFFREQHTATSRIGHEGPSRRRVI